MKRDTEMPDAMYLAVKDTLDEIVKKCVIMNIQRLLEKGSLDVDIVNTVFQTEHEITVEQPAVHYTTKKDITIRRKFNIVVDIDIEEIQTSDMGH